MGMFKPVDETARFSKKEMVQTLTDKGIVCILCGTLPHQMVFNQYKQTVHCPRCGISPHTFTDRNQK
jgi:uncharacterized CHY-type Zn-finger protein